MSAAPHSAELFDALERVKREATQFTTSLFAGRAQVELWRNQGILTIIEIRGCVLLLRRDRDFDYLHHVAAGRCELAAGLEMLSTTRNLDRAVVTDLVGTPEVIQSVADLYRERGFADHTTLVRMMRIGTDTSAEYAGSSRGMYAEANDGPSLCAFLNTILDPLRDRIPTMPEITAAAASHNVLIERRGGAIGGVLFFETIGLTSVLRYWYVAPEFHGHGIGGRLMRAYLHACRGMRRILLWVVADNSDAVAKYQHYGFRQENLVDQIMVSERAPYNENS